MSLTPHNVPSRPLTPSNASSNAPSRPITPSLTHTHDPSSVLHRLLSSNAQWAADVEHAEHGFFQECAKGQAPKVCVFVSRSFVSLFVSFYLFFRLLVCLFL